MARARSRRAPQCCYAENNRRCRKSGSGNPPLCNVHRIVVEQAARGESGIGATIDGIITGRVTVEEAFSAFVNRLRYSTAPHHVSGRSSGAAPPRSPFTPPPRPQVDPLAAKKARDLALAKRVMGWGDYIHLTPAMIRERHRELAKKFHPDRKGGSHEKMREINAAVDTLYASL